MELIFMQKKRYDEWYFYDSIDKFIEELDFVYNTYINNIHNIFDTPEKEAKKYMCYLEKNSQELTSYDPDDAFLEIESKGQKRYYFVMNMKYRNLAIYIDLIYQMLEQFIMSFCEFQKRFHTEDKKLLERRIDRLDYCASVFKDFFDLDIKKFNKYNKINELRLLQNVLKHSDGKSKDELLKIRPDYFIENKNCFTIYKNTIIDPTLNISENDFKDYIDSIKEFLKQFPDKIVHEFSLTVV